MTNKQKRKIEKNILGFVPTKKEDRNWCGKEWDLEKSFWNQLNRYLNDSDYWKELDSYNLKWILENLRAFRMRRNRIRAYFDQMK